MANGWRDKKDELVNWLSVRIYSDWNWSERLQRLQLKRKLSEDMHHMQIF